MHGQELKTNIGRNIFKELGFLGYSVELQGQKNFRLLKDNPSIPAILIFNHVSLDDPVLVGTAALSNLGNEIDFVVPVSYYHSQYTDQSYPKLLGTLGRDMFGIYKTKLTQKLPQRKKQPSDEEFTATLQQLNKSSLIILYSLFAKLGINMAQVNMPRLVQAYSLRDKSLSPEDFIAWTEKSKKLFMDFNTQIKKIFLNGGVIMLSPEGHRSKDGRLQPAEDGIGLIIRELLSMLNSERIFDGIILPVGIISDSLKRGINFNPISKRQVILKIGQPKTLKEIERSAKQLVQQNPSLKTRTALTNVAMLQLRELLPEQMWGVYHPDILADTLAGRFELRVNPETREAGVFDIKNNNYLG